MKKKTILLLLVLLFMSATESFASSMTERKDSIYVWGKVRDLFTNELINAGHLTVFDERDSIVVLDTIRGPQEKNWGTWKYTTDPEFNFKLPRGGSYKVRFDIEGYVAEMHELVIPDRQYHKYTKDWNKDFKVRKKPKEHVINGVEIKATRIKMVVKGDTIEYDADAFNLAEGSMLDKLLDAMPGMELKDNGEIYSNGKKVESLLVNGKDFFSGDPKMALENLPAYAVKKVQVYRKDDDAAYLIKDSLKRDEMKKLVVDVKLKKEYSKSWILTTDMAYGTQQRYVARVAGLYFSDIINFTAYGNLNNLNLTGGADHQGNWDTNSAPQGLHRKKSAGFRFQYDKSEKFKFNLGASVNHSDDLNESTNSSETYLTSGSTFSRSRSVSRNCSTDFNLWNWSNFALKNVWIGFQPIEGGFSRRRGSGNSNSATFNADPMDSYRGASLDSLYLPGGSQRLEEMRINSVLNATQSLTTSSNLRSSANFWLRSPIFGNNLGGGYNISYNQSESKNYQHYTLDNRQANNIDKRNVYTLSPSHSFNASGRMNYSFGLGKDKGHIDLNYNISFSESRNRPERYRLDSLGGWTDFDRHPMGELPSAAEMNRALDVENSYHSANEAFRQAPGLSLGLEISKALSFNTDLQLVMEKQRVRDTRAAKNEWKSQSICSFEPSAGLRYYKNKEGVIYMGGLNYRNSRSMPSAAYLLNLTDNTNPLFISKSNPDLKNSMNHALDLDFRYSNAKHIQNYGGNIHWDRTQNSVASATLYDRQTGVTTYQPRNINGNWQVSANFNFDRTLDKNDRLSIRNSIGGGYVHNVDYISDYEGQQSEPERSVVLNKDVHDELRLTYRNKERMIEAVGNITWRGQSSERKNFNRLNAVEFNYGLRSHGPIVWGFEYETDLRVYSRRGYNDASMNDDNIVWGLKLSRSFLKGKPLTLKLEAHDLLRQLNNVRQTINAQGRTETWYNSIPSYALLHVIYKFNSMSKKKGGEKEKGHRRVMIGGGYF